MMAWGVACFIITQSKSVCNIVVLVGAMGYVLVKWSLYMLLSFRLDAAFAGSLYAYSRRFLYFWRGCLVLFIVVEILTTLPYSDSIVLANDKYMPCRSNFPSSLLGIFALTDIIACFVNLFLFIRQLKRVTAALKRHDNLWSSNSSSRKVSYNPTDPQNNHDHHENPNTNHNSKSYPKSLSSIKLHIINSNKTNNINNIHNINNTNANNTTTKNTKNTKNNSNLNSNNDNAYEREQTGIIIVEDHDSMGNYDHSTTSSGGVANSSPIPNTKIKKGHVSQVSSSSVQATTTVNINLDSPTTTYTSMPVSSLHIKNKASHSIPKLSDVPSGSVNINGVNSNSPNLYGQVPPSPSGSQGNSGVYIKIVKPSLNLESANTNSIDGNDTDKESGNESGAGAGAGDDVQMKMFTNVSTRGRQISTSFRNKLKRSTKQKRKQDKFLRVVRKHVVLSVVGVGSTLISLGLIIVFSMPVLLYVF